MKLNLLINDDEIFAGYLNIDAIRPSEHKQKGDVLNLNWIATENSCHAIRAVDILDYVDASQKENVLRHWVSLLQKGGTITIGGNDIYLTARALYKHELSFQDASNILYGPPNTALSKSGLLGVVVLKDFLKTLGVKITSTKIDNYRYIIQGIKN